MRYLVIVICLGMSACAKSESAGKGIALCDGLRRPVDALERGLLAHPETPTAVGEAGTDVVVGFVAGCNR